MTTSMVHLLRSHRLALTLLGCTTTLVPLAAAWSAESGAMLEEIVVTAQKRAESLQDVPISVGVFQGEAIAEMGVLDLGEMSTNAPSLLINQGPSQPGIYMRAVGSGTNNVGFEQSVGMFVDGVYMSKARLLRQPFFDIERVELVKGPQNVLFGKNTTAGAITTANPTPGFEALVSGLYGDDSEYQIDGMVSGPLTERLGGRLAVRASGMDGYMHDTFRDIDVPRVRDLAGRVTLQYDPADTLTLTLKGLAVRSRVDGGTPIASTIHGPALLPALSAVDPNLDLGKNWRRSTDGGGLPDGKELLDTDVTLASLNIDWEIGDWMLTSLSAFAGYEYSHWNDSDFTANPAFQIANLTGSEYEQLSQELRIQSPVGETFEFMAGAYYQDSDTKFEDAWTCANLAPPFVPAPVSACGLARFSQEQQTSSAFVRGTWNITDAFRVTGGLRYTHEKKTASNSVIATDFDRVGPATPFGVAVLGLLGLTPHSTPQQKRTEEDWSPGATVQYDVTGDIMAYASYNKGHKSGGFNALEWRGMLENFQFDGERARSIEFGAKMRHFGGRATTNIAVFFSKFADLQVSSFDGQIFNVDNADADVDGVEADFAFRVTDGLSVSASVVYLDAKVTDYLGPCRQGQTAAEGCFAGRQDLAGTPLQYSAEWQGTFAIDYQRSIGNSLVGRAHLDLFATSDVNLAPDNDPRTIQDGYARINARLAIGAHDGRWELAAIGKNLGNEYIKSYENDIPALAGSYFANIQRGRSWAVQGTMKF